jgi:hypothetical protein
MSPSGRIGPPADLVAPVKFLTGHRNPHQRPECSF